MHNHLSCHHYGISWQFGDRKGNARPGCDGRGGCVSTLILGPPYLGALEVLDASYRHQPRLALACLADDAEPDVEDPLVGAVGEAEGGAAAARLAWRRARSCLTESRHPSHLTTQSLPARPWWKTGR